MLKEYLAFDMLSEKQTNNNELNQQKTSKND